MDGRWLWSHTWRFVLSGLDAIARGYCCQLLLVLPQPSAFRSSSIFLSVREDEQTFIQSPRCLRDFQAMRAIQQTYDKE
jgi:hypothetical protein